MYSESSDIVVTSATWSIAIAIGISFAHPSDLRIDQPTRDTHAVVHDVRWAGQSFVSPLYYVVRLGYGDVALDFTHFKIIAETQRVTDISGTWHGAAVSQNTPISKYVQHFELSHGVNSIALIALAHNPAHRSLYAGIGPVIFMPHAETRLDDSPNQWGYAYGGVGFEAVGGVGMPAPFADVKYISGHVRVGISDGTASTLLSAFAISAAP